MKNVIKLVEKMKKGNETLIARIKPLFNFLPSNYTPTHPDGPSITLRAMCLPLGKPFN